ncbi:Uncharacterised protein [uncultured Clostridium sp.]|nr:Uncharacterised protein [uncultured Clostridium sp.]
MPARQIRAMETCIFWIYNKKAAVPSFDGCSFLCVLSPLLINPCHVRKAGDLFDLIRSDCFQREPVGEFFLTQPVFGIQVGAAAGGADAAYPVVDADIGI